MSANADVLWRLVEHLLLTGAPGIAAALFLVRRGARSVPVILASSLAASGVVALLAFWAYYASPEVGQVWAFVALFGSIQVIALSVYRGKLDVELLRQLRIPLLLWVLGSFFVVFLGFLHGGTDQAIGMSSARFSGQLPFDNDIPQFFASWFYEHGHQGVPPEYPGEWLMSDRPPLQVGYVLSQRTYAWDATGLHYEVLGVVIQQLWIIGMWAVLCAARLRPSTRALAMFAAMVSDVAILHGFYVWPKLLAAAFVLGAVALVVSPQWAQSRRDPRMAALLACLCALAMLSHGSSVFGVVPLLVIATVKGLPSRRWIGVGALVGLSLLAPWSAYQHYDDPPGNRLLKWQLGGAVDIDDRGTLEAISDGYREAGLSGTLDNKESNFAAIAGLNGAWGDFGDAASSAASGELDAAAGSIRGPRFFSFLPFLGVFLIAPIAMLVARQRGRASKADWRFAIFCFWFTGIACLVWGLLLFGSEQSTAVLHVGSLAVPLLALCGCIAGLRATFPRLAVALVAFNALSVLVLYTPSLTPPPGTGYSAIAALIAAASLIAFGAVVLRLGGGTSSA